MKKETDCFNITLFILVLFILCAVRAAHSANIFQPAIEQAAEQAVAAWAAGDDGGLKAALERLTRNEAYLLAIGEATKEKSYLVRIPRPLNKNMDSIAAYLFLLRKEREGIRLWPKSFFEGQSFTFNQKGEE